MREVVRAPRLLWGFNTHQISVNILPVASGRFTATPYSNQIICAPPRYREAKMVRHLHTTLIARPGAAPIIVVKASAGTFHAPWEAARAIEAMKATMPAERLHLSIVVMVGDPARNPRLFGSSSDAAAHIRSVLAAIADPGLTWEPIALDC
jgi:hypothetical protein